MGGLGFAFEGSSLHGKEEVMGGCRDGGSDAKAGARVRCVQCRQKIKPGATKSQRKNGAFRRQQQKQLPQAADAEAARGNWPRNQLLRSISLAHCKTKTHVFKTKYYYIVSNEKKNV